MPTRKWGVETLVNTTTAGSQTSSIVTLLADGRFVVVWQDGSGAHSAIRGQVFDATGKRIGSEIAIDVAAGNDEILPSVTGLANGSFYVTWTQRVGTSNYILGNVYNADGAFIRSQPADFDSDLINNSDVAPTRAGAIVVFEKPNGGSGPEAPGIDIGFRIMNADGTGGAVLVANSLVAGDQVQPTIAATPDGELVAIAWVDQRTGRISGHLYLEDGFSVASDFTIYALDPLPSNNTLSSPDITWLNFQDFVVTWSLNQPNVMGSSFNEEDVELRVFRSGIEGIVPLTDTIRVNSRTPFFHFNPTVTPLPDGGFVVAWEDLDVDTPNLDSDRSIKLQAFDSLFARMGREITVNTTTSGVQSQPSIAALQDGRVVVTWTDDSASGGDTSGSAIRMQIIDPRDGSISGTSGNDVLYGNDLVLDEISAGAGDDRLNGMSGDDALYGAEGKDVLDGGKGADMMVGGTGNDTYYVDNVDDVIIENTGEGIDTVRTTLATYTLADNVERLTFVGSGNFKGTGNALANTLTGGSGTSTLKGGDGNDVLVAGLHAALTGGAGIDRFEFTTPGTVAAPDTNVITDFVHSGDRISFRDSGFNLGAAEGTGTAVAHALPAALFSTSTNGSFATTANRFAYDTASGNLYYDADGSSTAITRQLVATVSNHALVTASNLYFLA